MNTYGFPRILKHFGVFPIAIESLPDGIKEKYYANLYLTHNQYTRVSESQNFIGSCGYAKRIVNEIPDPNSTGNKTVNETLGNLPLGLIFSQLGNGINAQGLKRLSSNLVARNATNSTHQSILFSEQESIIVQDVVLQVWNRILGDE